MKSPQHPIGRIGEFLLALALLTATGLGCASSTKPADAQPADTQTAEPQRVFSTPTQAVDAFLAAMRDKDLKALQSIFGPNSAELISSGDPIDDQHQREVIVAAMQEKWSLADKGENHKELIIGNENWPCPVPIVHGATGWRFDTEAGAKEVLARRIGRNELAVINDFRTYVQAQKEYAAESRDGQPAGAFAQKPRSDEGKHNGLYWPIAPGEQPSPLGEFVSKVAADGYSTSGAAGSPFHGYRFRVLTAQGPDAPGGAKNYVEGGRMTGGFALLAYPADYENSGIMCFMVGKDGVVLQADLGEATAATAASITAYNPDARWKPTP